MKILLCAVGSHGDVLPVIALGRELQRRGHAPQLFANAAFEPLAQAAGLPFTATGSAQAMADALRNPDATDARKGLALLAQGVLNSAAQGYPLLCQALGQPQEPGGTLVVGTSLAWAARLLSETHGVPGAVLHLAPSWLRSGHVAPSLGPLGHLAGAPRWVKRGLFRVMDRHVLDPLFTRPFNALRASPTGRMRCSSRAFRSMHRMAMYRMAMRRMPMQPCPQPPPPSWPQAPRRCW